MATTTTRVILVVALCLVGLALFPGPSFTDETADDTAVNVDAPESVDADLSAHKSTGTDAEVVEREEQAIKLDGMSVAEAKLLREKADTFEFQAEVNRMMKLIINSLYKNKDIFLRELISNASDALDKIRFLSLTDKDVLGDVPDLHIKIHADKDNGVLHITDTGIGMTREDLINNLGTIAKSGTSEFLTAISEGKADASSLIGQFGVGFYSAFLVADTVVVTTKHNNDKQYIWTSDAASFSIVEDPREDEQLGRGTRISLYLKDEAREFLQENRIRDLVRKYSEFINFDIYLYTSKEVEIDVEAEEEALRAEEEELLDEDEEEAPESEDDADDDDEGYEGDDEDEDEEEEDEDEVEAEPTKTTRTVWDWEVINANKPIWTRNPKEVEDEEYNNFYKAFSKDTKDPLGKIHFTAEGEVTFRSILYIPQEAPAGFFNDYGNTQSDLKLYVRRVFITDEFDDMLPKYLGFIRGVVDSDDLPLNVSRETLQQHKLLRVIKKKIVRKALEMIKKLDDESFKKFWKEFGTSIKLGLIEDFQNKSRLAKLVRFHSSHEDGELTSLDDYVARMKKNQEHIFFVAGSSMEEVKASPFVERLLKRGYEVLYLTEPVDEYTIQNLPEYDGKKFQNAAKEGLKLDDSEAAKKYKEEQEEEFKPLTEWLGEHLSEDIEKAVVSDRLTDSPCALVASQYGWSGNMERIMKAQAYARQDDAGSSFYARQKKTLEINPRHPLIKSLLERAKALEDEEDATDETLEDTARVLLDTARLRSGYLMQDSVGFAQRIERMLRLSAGVDLDAPVEEEPVFEDEDEDEGDEDEDEDEEIEDEDEEEEDEEEEGEEEEEEEGEEAEGVAHEEL
ncbi:heat shock protein gp96 [Salpingoeca rosetta]|uniref:Heat shock protein gp96 n=1 Tax=Salpingoeca rosetta (strain ATCC 50818 / BSB-021) TaxID=946362 RepID=F2U8F6_SALR5|nr:heat shock protein gp96 [Salpingoeca rosetta]EGD72664.1 heat shock protein gp96 [Salpingoeca rosetta]|eukprot:XP_004994487.1 heat shock protein gp96 [Salpingoeca rosetta]